MTTTWEYYQGDGENGPFGFIDGWFVSWSLNDCGELVFSLDLDQHDIDTGELDAEDVADEGETKAFVTQWLAGERDKDFSRALATLQSKCVELRQASH